MFNYWVLNHANVPFNGPYSSSCRLSQRKNDLEYRYLRQMSLSPGAYRLYYDGITQACMAEN